MPRQRKRPKRPAVPFTESQHLRLGQAIHNLQALLACTACQSLSTNLNGTAPSSLTCNHLLCPSCTSAALEEKACPRCQVPAEKAIPLPDVAPVAAAVHQLVQFRREVQLAAPLKCSLRLRIREEVRLEEQLDEELGEGRVDDDQSKSVLVRLRVREGLPQKEVKLANDKTECDANGKKGAEERKEVDLSLSRDNVQLQQAEQKSATPAIQNREDEPGQQLQAEKRKSGEPRSSERETAQTPQQARGEIQHATVDNNPVPCRLRLKNESHKQSTVVTKRPDQAAAEVNATREVSVPVTSPTVLEENSPHLSRGKSPFLSEVDNESTVNSHLSGENVIQHAQNTRQVPAREKKAAAPFYVCINRLSEHEQEVELAEEIVTRFGWEMVSDFRNMEQPCCVITELYEADVVHRSMVVHEALARRVPVVGLSWLIESFRAGKRLETREFEAATDHRREGRGIFEGVVASVDKGFERSGKTLTRKAGEDIGRVMRAGGAMVVDVEKLAETVDRNSEIKLHVHVVCDFMEEGEGGHEISEEQVTELQSLIPFTCTSVVDMEWISECIFSGHCPPPQGEKSDSASGVSEHSVGEVEGL